MNALDANVLVRWITNDESAPYQVRAVGAMLADAEGALHVNLVVLAETIWVIGYTYRVSREGIIAAIRALLNHPRLHVERLATVERALAAYETGGTGFVDHLIGVLNEEAGCATTLTFDKRAAKGPLFTLIS